MMCSDAGQQRLRTAEERLAPPASATRAEAAPARVEVDQESWDEEMNEACVTNNAENVKLWIEAPRKDSTEAVSRMEDGNTPVGDRRVFYRRESEDQRKETSRPGQGRNVGACRRVGNVHERDDSDPQVAGCGVSE